MRVIAGKYRGRLLRSLRGTDIRPTSDRLRETLFNVLTAGDPQALEGTVWVDLFAGTGAVGIEAISRGAKQVYFVETSAAAAKLIEQNLQSLGIASGYKILRDDLPGVLWRLQREHVDADVVFLDPPYRCSTPMKRLLRRSRIRRWCGLCRWWWRNMKRSSIRAMSSDRCGESASWCKETPLSVFTGSADART